MEKVTLIDFANLQRVLEEYGNEVRNMYQDNLIRHDRIATGELLNTVESRVEVNGRIYSVVLSLQDYWRDVEEGTKPHTPPVEDILRWIQVKPVLPRPGANGRIPTQRQLAQMIVRKIARVGTEGSHDLEDAVNTVHASFAERIAEALDTDVSLYLSRVMSFPGKIQ